LASFDRKWPDTQTSPGGIPPTVAIVSRVQIANSRAGIAVSTQVQMHNIRGQKPTLSARVLEQGKPQQIALTRQYAVDQTAPDSISFEIPKSRLQSPKKASLLFEVISGDETLHNSGPIALGSSHKTNNESKTVVASTSHAANQALILAHVAKKGEKPEEGVVPDDQNSLVTQAIERSRKPSQNLQELPRSEKVSLSNGEEIAAPPQASPMCVVEVKSNPPGAMVEASGYAVGKTPVVIQFPPNGLAFNILVEKDGYRPWLVQTAAIPGRQTFDAELISVPTTNDDVAPSSQWQSLIPGRLRVALEAW